MTVFEPVTKVFKPVIEADIQEASKNLMELMQESMKESRSEFEATNKFRDFKDILKEIKNKAELSYLVRFDRIKETQE